MIPELGHFALILALCMALVLAVVPIAGAMRSVAGWVVVARPAAYGQLLFVLVAYACLTHSFLVHDFSVYYVAMNSNTALPTLYLFSGVWGRTKARCCCGPWCCPVGRPWLPDSVAAFQMSLLPGCWA